MIRIRRGLNVPLAGAPEQSISDPPEVAEFGVVGSDYLGLKPTIEVAAGDVVRLGQTLFTDKKNPDVRYTAPVGGKVVAINRGEKRRFLSLAIARDGNDEVDFSQYRGDVAGYPGKLVTQALLDSGLWPAMRTRPYNKVPVPGTQPRAIFVQAMETQPLAADSDVILEGQHDAFRLGLLAMSRLTEGKVYVCHGPNFAASRGASPDRRIEHHEFDGPHPAGLPGTHMHFLAPASPQRVNWFLHYQDVVAIGRLFLDGRLSTERVVALCGPRMKRPRLVRVPLGANLLQLCAGEVETEGVRLVAGSALYGRTVQQPEQFLARYSYQVTALLEGYAREFLGWQMPGLDKFSIKPIYLGTLLRAAKLFPLTTSTQGSKRAMVPVDSYEEVMPLDLLPTQLLRSLIIGDTQSAQDLGCLELDEEDVALCTFVCPGKYDYAALLRENLTRIELEG
jgi:Na+-transporting NADH:ubiquinone oxidoreductase subunit A